MIKKFFTVYFAVPLVWRILAGFVLGIGIGLLCSQLPDPKIQKIVSISDPFGLVLISMLKMVVFPIIFFSLILGSASLPLKKSGKLGLSVMVWYFLTSLFATVFGVLLAFFLNPKMANFSEKTAGSQLGAEVLKNDPTAGNIGSFFAGLFQNPFEALAHGRFLPIVIFSILFGLAARVLLDHAKTSEKDSNNINAFLSVCDAARIISFKLIDWIMEYFPFGVFALTFTNFMKNGTILFGPYLRIVSCVVIGVLGMLLLIYPLAVLIFCRENPYRLLFRLRAPILTAFATRSSAATLPISLQTSEKLGISSALSSFSLPLGCTVNMDGVCVHLPVFVILAGNIFGVPFGLSQLLILLLSVVFASIGAGGIPGGSVFLLFMILENAGFEPAQVASIVALALGINPILDMFETACNVAGDNICTYIVAKRGGMIKSS
ncbi:MAG: dicarboxylate/amino acid:cation symporter [Planctomycetia bacterium]|nr:dicarboxylate/amino acid:cation symporter [Planctomycetia bacterium]